MFDSLAIAVPSVPAFLSAAADLTGPEGAGGFAGEPTAAPGTILALVLVLGVSAQWLAWRLKVPSILLLLLFGFLAGPVAKWATVSVFGLDQPYFLDVESVMPPTVLLAMVSLAVLM